MSRTIVLNSKAYKEDIRGFYKSILEGRFLSLSPYDMDDKQLMDSIPLGKTVEGKGIDWVDNLCSWYVIGEKIEAEYFGKKYYSAELCYAETKRVLINYSRFIYPIYINTPVAVWQTKNVGINKVDEEIIDPYRFFNNNKGEKFLYLWSQIGSDKFKKRDLCSFFSFRNITPDNIRKYILMAQLDVLFGILNSPCMYYVPPTAKISSQFDNDSRWYGGESVVFDVVSKIFQDEFKESYLSKFLNVHSALQDIN